MPRVTVAVPARDAAPFLEETLASIAAQTYRDFELIVVDDGSTDETGEIAERAGARVLWKNQVGPGAARNAAIRAGSGELIALLDADDLWLPEKLALQVETFDEIEPEALLVGTLVESFGGPPPPAVPLFGGRVTERLIANDFLTTSSVMFRREAFDRVGGFDPDPDMVAVEDYDLWLRMSLLGPFGGVHRKLVRRRLHEANLSADPLMLNRRALRVIEKFEALPNSRPFAAAIRLRKAELNYLIGRIALSRGDRAEARRALRRSRSHAPTHLLPCLALETLSLLPGTWLVTIRRARAHLRRRKGDIPL